MKFNFIKNKKDSANVIAPPPFIYLGGILLGLFLHYIKPLEIFKNSYLIPLGWILIVISIIIFVMAVKSFARAKTNISPYEPTTSIIMKGPYNFSRNPIYLSMTIFYFGIMTLLNDLWFLIILIPLLFIIQYGVIKREEKYLTKKFGKKYMDYKKCVNRWL